MRLLNASTPAILITGASSGIGEACALELDCLGFRVFAGVRSDAAAQSLRTKASSRLTPLMIDVTEAASIAAAAGVVAKETGDAGLAGLVNNAGIVVSGPLEAVPLDALRRQFEVNVVGQVAVTQAMLPLLRKAAGRVVHIGSVNGAMSPPYMGPYSASKYALEAINDALRLELRTWGIKVSIVEAGPIATSIWEKSAAAADRLAEQAPDEILKLYDADLAAMRKTVDRAARGAKPVECVVRAVVHALTAKRPKSRYYIGWSPSLLFTVFGLFPNRLRDWLIRREIGLR